MAKEVTVGNVTMGADEELFLIAGPCVIESEASAFRHAKALKAMTAKLGMPFVFKASYDKANRTSIRSYRGPGIKKGLAVLQKIKDELGLPVLSDVHCREELKSRESPLDIIQIPAFLCRQTDLIVAAAETGKAVNVKKGQFLAPWDMQHVIKKIESTGNRKVILTERGISFGYNNLVSDFRSLLIMKQYGYPVVYDATHSVQAPSGKGDKSGGDSCFVPYLASAAVTCGADGIFVEVHEDPDKALSDGPNMIRLGDLECVLQRLLRIKQACTAERE